MESLKTGRDSDAVIITSNETRHVEQLPTKQNQGRNVRSKYSLIKKVSTTTLFTHKSRATKDTEHRKQCKENMQKSEYVRKPMTERRKFFSQRNNVAKDFSAAETQSVNTNVEQSKALLFQKNYKIPGTIKIRTYCFRNFK